jgi:sec-independent protein translocase protein TatA
MAGFGWQELLIVLLIAVVIFGVGKVADVGPALGKAIRGFREAVKEDETPKPEEQASSVEHKA